MALLAEHLVGRADELASLEQVLGELDRGRSGAIALMGAVVVVIGVYPQLFARIGDRAF